LGDTQINVLELNLALEDDANHHSLLTRWPTNALTPTNC